MWLPRPRQERLKKRIQHAETLERWKVDMEDFECCLIGNRNSRSRAEKRRRSNHKQIIGRKFLGLERLEASEQKVSKYQAKYPKRNIHLCGRIFKLKRQREKSYRLWGIKSRLSPKYKHSSVGTRLP